MSSHSKLVIALLCDAETKPSDLDTSQVLIDRTTEYDLVMTCK